MSAPTVRRNRREPVSKHRGPWPLAMPRRMELLGCTANNQLFAWQQSGMVLPISRFPMSDRTMIVTGHYVIHYKGCAVVVHCGNGANGMVSVRHMGRNGRVDYQPRKLVESDLLGRVVRDDAEEGRITAMLAELGKELDRRRSQPGRLRGRAGA